MTEKEQIREMASILCEDFKSPCGFCYECHAVPDAQNLYKAGYRKQSEGEWLNGVNGSKVCSMCGKEPLYTKSGTPFATTFYKVKSNYCPNCGAKMKRGDNDDEL